MRNIMIATPTLDGKLDVYYVDSLMRSIQLGSSLEINIQPLYIAYDSLIQRARNDLIFYAVQQGVDDMVFIDADMGWNPEHLLKLLNYPVDVVSGTARKKGDDKEEYVVRALEIPMVINEMGLVEVSGTGTGFLRLSKKAYTDIYHASTPYQDRGVEKRFVFNVEISPEGDLMSEDICMTRKLTALGYKLWFDPDITCLHIGTKVFAGDFHTWARNNKLIKRED